MKGYIPSSFVNYKAGQGVIVWVNFLINNLNKKKSYKSF